MAGEPICRRMTGGRLDAAILRQLLIALAMITIMLVRPRGLWPSPEHGKAAPTPPPSRSEAHAMSDIVLNVSGRLQALRRPAGAVRRGHHDPQRPGLRPDRPQRRRQDHLLQRASPGLYTPDSGSFELGGKPYKPTRGARGGQGRHRAHLPEHPPVRRDDGAGERDGRPPRAHRTPGLLGAVFRTAGFKAEEAAIAKRAQELLDYVGIGKLRRLQGAHAELRRPAPPGDRARAGHRPAS